MSKVNFENSVGFEVNGQKFRVKHAVQAQNIFRHVVRRAEDIGMKVNAKKTAMMCTSGATEYKADAYMFDSEGNRIGCTEFVKALGVYLSSDLTLTRQVDVVARRFRQRYWTLRNLKKNGFNEEELVHVYKTMLRPIAEYACVAFHSSFTDAQDELIERLQDNALKCIFGPGISARRMRDLADLPTLRARRIELTDKFAKK